MERIWGGCLHKCLQQRKKDTVTCRNILHSFQSELEIVRRLTSFPLVILNSFQTPTRCDCLIHTLPIVFFVSSHLSSLQKRWSETPHPLGNPCNNYFGISCFATITITCSIAISIAMAFVPFNLIGLLKGLMTMKPFLDHFLALGSSVFKSIAHVIYQYFVYTTKSIIPPRNNYFGISCYATVIITRSIAIAITMALVSFHLISLPKGLMTMKLDMHPSTLYTQNHPTFKSPLLYLQHQWQHHITISSPFDGAPTTCN